jgi:arylsulfatase A
MNTQFFVIYYKNVCTALIFFAFIAFIFSVVAPAKAQSKKPNIVIILADDMGYGDVSFLNPQARTKTPSIDKMAQKSLVFTDAHTGGAVCTPSRYGIMTGRYYFRIPPQGEFLGYLQPLIEQGRETIGSLMQSAGYTTACIGKWHLGVNWGLKDEGQPQIPKTANKTITNTDFKKDITGGPGSLGFNYTFILPASLDMPPYVFIRNNKVIDPDVVLTADVYPKTRPGTEPVWDRKYTNSDDVYWERGVWWRNGEMSKSFKMEDCLDSVSNEGLAFITNHVKSEPKKPFMLYLALTAPHTPWLPDNQYKGKTTMGTYGDFVFQVDNIVEQVNNKLKELNIDNNTIVIFTSDNGAPWAEEDIQTYGHKSNWGRRGQKGDIYDGGHHVPLIIKWPAKIKQKATYNPTVSLLDFMATFSELTGQLVKKPYGEDSFSLLKVINGNLNKPVRDNIIYESSGRMLAIKKGDWKFIDGLGSGGFTAPVMLKPVKNGPKGQLYNLKTDPLESNNLYMQYPVKVKELSDLLEKLKKQGYSN